MSIFTDLKDRFFNRKVREYVEDELTEYVAEKHHAAIMSTLVAEYPGLAEDTFSTSMIDAVIKRANQRLLQHII